MNKGHSKTNSIFFNETENSVFFSDFLSEAICLQRQHRCLPSNVRVTASCNDPL